MPVTTATEIFATQIPNRLQAKPELAQKINAVYKFVVTGAEAATWVVDLTKPGGVVQQGEAGQRHAAIAAAEGCAAVAASCEPSCICNATGRESSGPAKRSMEG